MDAWIPFREGEYLVERAALVAPSGLALALEGASVSVVEAADGRRHLSGSARVLNLGLVELLEEGDQVDLLLDFGGEFKFRLPGPVLRAGKVFAAGVRSALQFSPSRAWTALTPEAFESQWQGLKFQQRD